MTMSKYFQQVCNKLSMVHGIFAFIGFIVMVVFVMCLLLENEEREFNIKCSIFSFIFTMYNIILFILIPSFEGVQI